MSEAFSYAINIEKNFKFQKDNVEWYEGVSRICEVCIINYIHIKIMHFYYLYLKCIHQAYEKSNSVNWEFYSRVLPIYEHMAYLVIIEKKSNKQKSGSKCYEVLFR